MRLYYRIFLCAVWKLCTTNTLDSPTAVLNITFTELRFEAEVVVCDSARFGRTTVQKNGARRPLRTRGRGPETAEEGPLQPIL